MKRDTVKNATTLTKTDIAMIRDALAGTFATKKDLEGFATKKDLDSFATKKDLEAFATKKDLEKFATKKDFKSCVTQKDFKAFTVSYEKSMRSIQQSFLRVDSILGILSRQVNIILEENREFRQRADRFDTDISLHERKIDNLTERVEVLEGAHT